jgi:hypothetical protein
LSLLDRTDCTEIRRRRSSFFGFPLPLEPPLAEFEREEVRDAPPEIDVGLLPEEEVLADFGVR